MTLQAIIELLEKAIADEERLDIDFHKGRVSALKFALSMLKEAKR